MKRKIAALALTDSQRKSFQYHLQSFLSFFFRLPEDSQLHFCLLVFKEKISEFLKSEAIKSIQKLFKDLKSEDINYRVNYVLTNELNKDHFEKLIEEMGNFYEYCIRDLIYSRLVIAYKQEYVDSKDKLLSFRELKMLIESIQLEDFKMIKEFQIPSERDCFLRPKNIIREEADLLTHSFNLLTINQSKESYLLAQTALLVEENLIIFDSFYDLLSNFDQDPDSWKIYLAEFKEKLKEKNLLSFSFVTEDNKFSEEIFKFYQKRSLSWKEVDQIVDEEDLKPKGGEKQPLAALREIAQTDAALTSGLIPQLIAEYVEDYELKEKELVKIKDPYHRNILHCLALAISNKVTSGCSLLPPNWEVYRKLSDKYPDLNCERNWLNETPFDILEQAGLSFVNETVIHLAYR